MLNNGDFSNRLEFIIKNYELNAASFADQIGVQRSSISHLLSGRNNPSLDFVLKVIDNFPEINFDWFVRGKGEKFSHEISTSQNSNEKYSKTPTLFDQITDNKEEIKRELPKINTSTNSEILESVQKKIKPIDKILVLYKDGSFDSYV